MTESDIEPSVSAKDVVVQVESGGKTTLLIDGIDVTLVPRDLVALVGPNGSGKSTLLRSLSRVLRPHSGMVMLGDRDLYTQTEARSAARQIGVVPQETHIAFDFTVREVVSMGRSPHRPRLSLLRGESDEDRRIVDNSLMRADVPLSLADRPIGSLSGGERQRVLIARALAQEASILLLDEPTASLDIRHERHLLSWLRELAHSEMRIVLVVLHDLNLAAQFADRIIVMHHGRIADVGTPEETLTADRIQEVYGTTVWVRKHPVTHRPYVLNLPAQVADGGDLEALRGRRIHLLGGGGMAAPFMMQLAGAGALLSLGALNLSDTDQEAATLLGITHPVAPPFCELSAEIVEAGVALGLDADAVVLCEAPFGDGNIGTLQAALQLASRGIPTILKSESKDLDPARDFSKERAATVLWAELTALPDVQIAADPIDALLDLVGGHFAIPT